MAKAIVTLAEGNEQFLAQYQYQPAPTNISYLAENKAMFCQLCEMQGARPVMLASFWDNLADDLGDFFSNITGIAKNIPQWYAASYGIPTGGQMPPQYPMPQTQGIDPNILLIGGLLVAVLLIKK